MLVVAVPGHLAFIESLIRSGACEGSWDPNLARPGPAASALFAKLTFALQHGALPQIDPRTGKRIVTQVAGWVFLPDPRCVYGTEGGQRCSHILKSLGFGVCRRTAHEEWLLHHRTPAPVVDLIARMDMAPFEPACPRSSSH